MASYKHELRAGQTLRARPDGLGGVVLDLIEGTTLIDSLHFEHQVVVMVTAPPRKADPRAEAGATVIEVDFERRRRK